MGLLMTETLFHRLESSDAIQKIRNLASERGFQQLHSSDIRHLADQHLTQALHLLDQLGPEDIKQLVNQWRVKSDVLGMALVYLGAEKLKHCIPQLLVYLQDINWPAAAYVGIVLRKMPAELMLPEIIQVIKNNHQDEVWIHAICSQLIAELNQADLLPLKKPLFEFIFASQSEESIEAATVLIPVIALEEFNLLSQHFAQVFVNNPPAIEEYKGWRDTYANRYQAEIISAPQEIHSDDKHE